MGTFNVSLKTLTDRVSMEVVYTPKELDQICVEIAEVNRPGLFLAGYYDYFDKLRLQIMGLAEMNFLSGLSAEKRYEALDQLFRQQPPAVIVCRSEELTPFPEMQELAQKHGVALLRSNETTCTLMGSLISVLNLELAPRITRHGVLVEVYGEGILILGDSGIGKSELAIELVKRGHRLVADDAVELRKVSNRQIMGTAPENIRHFIELRGIGIINVARVYGVGAVKLSESLDLVVQLEAWDPTKNYQRTGLENEYYDILGVSIPSTSIPVSPGRNLAVVLETAAINNRQKKMGYNAARELLIRLGLDGSNGLIPHRKRSKLSWNDSSRNCRQRRSRSGRMNRLRRTVPLKSEARHSCLSCRKTSSSSAVQLRFARSRLSAITCWATAATSCLRTKAFPAW